MKSMLIQIWNQIIVKIKKYEKADNGERFLDMTLVRATKDILLDLKSDKKGAMEFQYKLAREL